MSKEQLIGFEGRLPNDALASDLYIAKEDRNIEISDEHRRLLATVHTEYLKTLISEAVDYYGRYNKLDVEVFEIEFVKDTFEELFHLNVKYVTQNAPQLSPVAVSYINRFTSLCEDVLELDNELMIEIMMDHVKSELSRLLDLSIITDVGHTILQCEMVNMFGDRIEEDSIYVKFVKGTDGEVKGMEVGLDKAVAQDELVNNLFKELNSRVFIVKDSDGFHSNLEK